MSRETLEQTGLLGDLYEVGYRLAQTMLELFADLPPDHEYFSQFSFIAPEDLPAYRALLTRADPAHLDRLSHEDRELLLAPTFKLIPARHRLGLITPELMEKVLAARRYFREHLPPQLCGAIAFFDPTEYNVAITIQENVIFGKIAYGQAQASQRIVELLTELLDKLDLRAGVMAVGLDSPVGIGGGRLSVAQRQKLGLARAVVKRPDILVLYDPLGPLDQREQMEVRDALLEALAGRSVIWALQHEEWASAFDQVIELDEGAAGRIRDRPPAPRAAGRSTPSFSPPNETGAEDDPPARRRRAAQDPAVRQDRAGPLKLLAFTSEHVEFRARRGDLPPGRPRRCRLHRARGLGRRRRPGRGRPDDGGADRPLRHRRRDRHPVRRAAYRHRGRDLAAGGPARVQGRLLQPRHPVPAVGVEVMHELASRLLQTTQRLTETSRRLREVEHAELNRADAPAHGALADQAQRRARLAGARDARASPSSTICSPSCASGCVAEGLPLARATMHLRTLHPQFLGARVLWRPGMAEAELSLIGHGMLRRAAVRQQSGLGALRGCRWHPRSASTCRRARRVRSTASMPTCAPRG